GAIATRNRALAHVTTPYVAFLDDDDEMLPEHLISLWSTKEMNDADYVYSYYPVVDPSGPRRPDLDPLGTFGKPFDPKRPVQTTVTTLVRTELAQDVGFSIPDDIPPTPDGNRAGEDWAFTLGCVAAGAYIHHLPERTWLWHWHGMNTSGRSWLSIPALSTQTPPEEESSSCPGSGRRLKTHRATR